MSASGDSSMVSLTSVQVPDHLHRNAREVLDAGIENGGQFLLELLARRLGRSDLRDVALLDLGCGVRFTQSLINRAIPFKSYTGIDVDRNLIQWLQEHVQSRDARFKFILWDVFNALYNSAPTARPMSAFNRLPADGEFDVITAFSVFTHLGPDDAEQMLRLVRRSIRADGYLFFSAFCHDSSVATFKDANPDVPLSEAYYGREFLEQLLCRTGWRLVSYGGPEFFIVDSFLCTPKSGMH